MQLADFLSGFADISVAQIAVLACVTLFASVVGGVAGYGTGALMPLVLVPMVGAEQVVPIIALAGLMTNTGRVLAFLRFVDWRAQRDLASRALEAGLVQDKTNPNRYVDTMLNTGCFNPTKGAGTRWSLYSYNLEIAPNGPAVFGKLLSSLYDDLEEARAQLTALAEAGLPKSWEKQPHTA